MSLRPDLEDKYVTTANGYRLRYIEKGSGHPLLCVHGLGITMAADQWINNIDALSRVAHVYSVDLPGWGYSDLPAEGYSFDMWSETLKGFCNALGLSEVDVVGQSLGGWISCHFAYAHPELVRRLVLCVNAGLNPAPRGVMGEFKMPDREAVRNTHSNLWRGDVQVTDELVEELYRRLQRPGREAAFRAIREFIGNPAVREEFSPRKLLPQMNMPILMLWGDNALPILLQYGLEQYQLAPNARLAVVFNGGENPQGHAPREFEAAAVAFLAAAEIESIKGS